MMDAFVPAQTPSGRPLRRIEFPSATDAMVRVATGDMVWPSVGSIIEHFRNPGVVAIPLPDLPPSDTALIWLTERRNSRKISAFIQVALDVLGSADREAPVVPAPHGAEAEPVPGDRGH
jgi:DNA-binding transcriptional LysR family regulator